MPAMPANANAEAKEEKENGEGTEFISLATEEFVSSSRVGPTRWGSPRGSGNSSTKRLSSGTDTITRNVKDDLISLPDKDMDGDGTVSVFSYH